MGYYAGTITSLLYGAYGTSPVDKHAVPLDGRGTRAHVLRAKAVWSSHRGTTHRRGLRLGLLGLARAWLALRPRPPLTSARARRGS